MSTVHNHIDINKMRSYSTVFSSTSFINLIKTGDLSFLNSRIQTYDYSDLIRGRFNNYLSYISYVYRELSKNYRTEYIYKNTFLTRLLIEQYGVKDTIVLNEFRIGNSVADTVLFNGVSKAFEIKTELDSKQRLRGQIEDYQKVFNECYIITDTSLIEKYAKENKNVGLIELIKTPRSIEMQEVRKPMYNKEIEPYYIMRCLRTEEYKTIVEKFYGYLPEMTSFNMFNICEKLICEIPSKILSNLFIETIKERKTNTRLLKSVKFELRQIALALNITEYKYQELINILNNPINL